MHGLKVRIVGSKASIEWWDERPNQLSFDVQGEPARILLRFAIAMEAGDRGDRERLASLRYPDIAAGVEGVRWVENCVRSADQGGVWVDYR